MKILPVSSALLLALAFGSLDCQEHARHHSKTYSLLPGATLNIVNKVAHEIDIRSEYPIQIAAGPCHADYTVQWHCSFTEPVDLFIRDLRRPPVFMTPRANTITLVASED
jgi:hypothetical protein